MGAGEGGLPLGDAGRGRGEALRGRGDALCEWGAALDHLGHAGGRVRYYADTGLLAYQYAFSDHLGNTRVLAEPDRQGVVQTSAYYTDSCRYSRSQTSEADPPRTKSSTTVKGSPTVTA